MKKFSWRMIVPVGITAIGITASLGYQASRTRVPKVDRDKTIVATVGDSNTFGVGVLLRRRRINSYPAQLERLLGDRFQVINYGLSGRTLLSTGDRPYTDEALYRISKAQSPDIVLVMLGTNDSKPTNWDADRFTVELRDLLLSYRELPNRPEVLVLTPPDAFKNRVGISPEIIREQIVPAARLVASELGLPLVDVFSATRGRSDLFWDGVHPNAAGYGLVARAACESLAMH